MSVNASQIISIIFPIVALQSYVTLNSSIICLIPSTSQQVQSVNRFAMYMKQLKLTSMVDIRWIETSLQQLQIRYSSAHVLIEPVAYDLCDKNEDCSTNRTSQPLTTSKRQKQHDKKKPSYTRLSCTDTYYVLPSLTSFISLSVPCPAFLRKVFIDNILPVST